MKIIVVTEQENNGTEFTLLQSGFTVKLIDLSEKSFGIKRG
jgi:hypothetical protein